MMKKLAAKGYVEYVPYTGSKLSKKGNEIAKILVIGVAEDATDFLHYLDKVNISIGSKLKVVELYAFDESMHILLNDEKDLIVSKQIAKNLFVKKDE